MSDLRFNGCDLRNGARLDWLGGNCPVQAEGTTDDGKAFYFRARGQRWSFHVAETEGKLLTDDTFVMDRPFGLERFAAGWMPEDVALGYIEAALAIYRRERAVPPDVGGEQVENVAQA